MPVVGNGRCLYCWHANPPDRWAYCSDECSEKSRAAQRKKKGVEQPKKKRGRPRVTPETPESELDVEDEEYAALF